MPGYPGVKFFKNQLMRILSINNVSCEVSPFSLDFHVHARPGRSGPNLNGFLGSLSTLNL